MSTQSVSADIWSEHIIQKKWTRIQSDQQAVNTVIMTKIDIKFNFIFFFWSFFTMIDHVYWFYHQFKMLSILKNFHNIWNHSEHKDFLQSCHQKIQKLEKKKIFQVVNKSDNAFLLFLMWVFDYKFDDNSFFLKHRSRIMTHDDL